MAKFKNSAKPLPKEHKLVEACVRYSQAIAAYAGSHEADPDGNCAYAARLGEPFYRRAKATLRSITKTRATTPMGLSAKARVALVAIRDAKDWVDQDVTDFLQTFAQDVKAALDDVSAEAFAIQCGQKGGAK